MAAMAAAADASRRLRPGVVRRGMRLLATCIREEPRSFTVAVVGAALYGGMTLAAALVFGWVTDRVVVPAFAAPARDVAPAALAGAAAALLGVALVKAFGIVLRRAGASLMQFRLQAAYRERVTRQYQRLPLGWHRQHSTGALLSHASSDVEAAFWPLAPLPFACGVILLLAGTAVALIVTDPFLALVGFAMGPALALLNWRSNRALQGPATRAQQGRAEVAAVAHESFDGALVVKALGREAAETERFAAAAGRLRDDLVSYGRRRARFDPLLEALPNVGVLVLLVVGVWRIQRGLLSQGDLVAFAYLFTLLAFPIRSIGWVLAELPRAVVGWERVQAVLEATGELGWGAERLPAGGGPAHVGFQGVAFTYDQHEVLHDVSFAVRPGRTVALVGATGSGKSTIARLALRLADPDSGTVRLDGHDLRSLSQGELPRSAAIVFQDPFLFDGTVRENVTLGEPFSDEQVRVACEIAQAHGFISALPDGYDTVVGERGTSLSGGQRQRLALARALVRRPRLLVLDDATSSVDTSVEAAILQGLRRADLPSTVVIVATRPATIALADEVVFVEQGRVTATGTPDELLATVPAYAHLLTAFERQRRERLSAEAG